MNSKVMHTSLPPAGINKQLHGYEHGQFDAIILGCALPEVNKDLKRLLALGGKLFVVVGAKNQMHATLFTRLDDNEWHSKSLFETYLDIMKGSEPSVKFTF